MAFSHSPKIATDGLVFYYDTGNGKSYKGEPATNLLGTTGDMSPPNPDTPYDLTTATSVSNVNGTTWDLSLYGGTSFATDNGVAWDPYIKGPNFTGAWRLKKRPGSNWETQFQNGLGAVTNTTSIVLSVWCKCSVAGVARINANTTRNGASNWGNSSAYHSGSGEWERLYYVIPANDGVTAINVLRCQVGGTTINTDVYFRHFQVEYGTHVTQFTTGTRSVTEGLLDLTKNSTLDLSNAGFNSSAELDFDGTNDYIDCGALPELDTGDVTIEFVAKLNTQNQVVVGKHYENFEVRIETTLFGGYIGHTGGWREINDANVAHEVDISEYNHYTYVFSYTTNNLYLYANGDYKGVMNGSSHGLVMAHYNTGTNLEVGRRFNGSGYLDGEVPVVKTYNKALSADEVAQNYNAIKNRFGI